MEGRRSAHPFYRPFGAHHEKRHPFRGMTPPAKCPGPRSGPNNQQHVGTTLNTYEAGGEQLPQKPGLSAVHNPSSQIRHRGVGMVTRTTRDHGTHRFSIRNPKSEIRNQIIRRLSTITHRRMRV